MLFVTAWFPEPPTNGARVRSSKLLAGLTAAGCRCYLFSFEAAPANGRGALDYVRGVTIAPPGRPPAAGRWRATAALLGRTPRHFRLTFQPEVVTELRRLVFDLGIDVIVAYELRAGYHAARVRAPEVVKILDGCEPFMFLAAKPNVRSRARLWKFKRFLRDLLEQYDGYIAVSDAELAWIRNEIGPRRSWGRVIPNGTELPPPYRGPVDLDRVIYTGSLTYRANLEAVEYFTREVWPEVRRRRPSARFVVTGQLPEPAVIDRLQAIPGVVLAGLRADYQEFVAGSGALAVTLQEGGGTRIKILEALALGCPVVATPKAVEGLDLDAGREVLVAQGAEQIAGAVVRAVTDLEFRARLIDQGRRAATRYSWERSQRLLVDAVNASLQQRAFLRPA